MDSPTPSKTDSWRETSDPINSSDHDTHDKDANEAALPSGLISAGSQHLHRKLGGKEIQLFAVGGAIGTCIESIISFIRNIYRRCREEC